MMSPQALDFSHHSVAVNDDTTFSTPTQRVLSKSVVLFMILSLPDM
jgi:hypothetical protein